METKENFYDFVAELSKLLLKYKISFAFRKSEINNDNTIYVDIRDTYSDKLISTRQLDENRPFTWFDAKTITDEYFLCKESEIVEYAKTISPQNPIYRYGWFAELIKFNKLSKEGIQKWCGEIGCEGGCNFCHTTTKKWLDNVDTDRVFSNYLFDKLEKAYKKIHKIKD